MTKRGLLIHDYTSDHDVKIVANIFRQKAKEFYIPNDFQDYAQRADGIWQTIFEQYKKDTGKELKLAIRDFGNYQNFLADKVSILLNKEVGSKKRNASFDFEKIIEKYGKANAEE